MIKMTILAPRRADLTHLEFRTYVTQVHGPLVKSVPEVARGILHYHYNFPVPSARDEAFGHPIATHLDIVTEGWFASRAAQLRNMAEPRYMEIIRPDEHKFAGQGALFHYMHEIEITPGLATPAKIFYFRRRRPDLNRAEFQSRWRRAMTEIVAESAIWPTAVSRYVQNHAFAEADHHNGEATYDVIDELFLPDHAALASLAGDPALISPVRALEAELLDPARTAAIVTERVINIP